MEFWMRKEMNQIEVCKVYNWGNDGANGQLK